KEPIRRRNQPVASAVRQLERERLGGIALQSHCVGEPLARWVVERVGELHPGLDQRDGRAQPRAGQHDLVLGVEHDEQVGAALDEDGIKTLEQGWKTSSAEYCAGCISKR